MKFSPYVRWQNANEAADETQRETPKYLRMHFTNWAPFIQEIMAMTDASSWSGRQAGRRPALCISIIVNGRLLAGWSLAAAALLLNDDMVDSCTAVSVSPASVILHSEAAYIGITCSRWHLMQPAAHLLQ